MAFVRSYEVGPTVPFHAHPRYRRTGGRVVDLFKVDSIITETSADEIDLIAECDDFGDIIRIPTVSRRNICLITTTRTRKTRKT